MLARRFTAAMDAPLSSRGGLLRSGAPTIEQLARLPFKQIDVGLLVALQQFEIRTSRMVNPTK